MGKVHGLTLLPEETSLFPKKLVKPLYRYSKKDPLNPGLVIMYQLDVDVCPHYEREVGCRIYNQRPEVCRAYPFEMSMVGKVVVHHDCQEARRLGLRDGDQVKIPRLYVEAALKVHRYYEATLSRCTEPIDSFDLDKGWTGILEGLSEDDKKFLRKLR